MGRQWPVSPDSQRVSLVSECHCEACSSTIRFVLQTWHLHHSRRHLVLQATSWLMHRMFPRIFRFKLTWFNCRLLYYLAIIKCFDNLQIEHLSRQCVSHHQKSNIFKAKLSKTKQKRISELRTCQCVFQKHRLSASTFCCLVPIQRKTLLKVFETFSETRHFLIEIKTFC